MVCQALDAARGEGHHVIAPLLDGDGPAVTKACFDVAVLVGSATGSIQIYQLDGDLREAVLVPVDSKGEFAFEDSLPGVGLFQVLCT